MKKKIVIWTSVVLIAAAVVLAVLLYHGILLFNNPSEKRYPVRGVDVSSYQGDIDWDILAGENIQFAFMKATEGSSFVDPNFEKNYSDAKKTKLRVGAYHFFSYDSSGKTQAENFIKNVLKTDSMLPPVIDIEFYGNKEKNPPDKNSVQKELTILLNLLEEHYGMKPILYATEKSYRLYIAEQYNEYDIWIRNVFSYPTLSDKRKWTFWQYTNREKLDGYRGTEKYIDMNVFYGSKKEFDEYAVQK